MPRLPLNDLIVHKETPLLTLELHNAALKAPVETVETYIFTDTIRHHFTEVLETVALGRGQGYWVEAEYGSGKTHFLATLTALLSDFSDTLWDKVSEDEIRHYQTRLKDHRLFPVILSLRGEASAETTNSRPLIDVLLEKGFRPALERAGLVKRVRLTMAQDLINWYEGQSDTDKTAIDTYILHKTGSSISDLLDNDDLETIAEYLNAYLAEKKVKALITTSVKDRLAGIYRQITSQGYAGILLIIDEYEGWANIHVNNLEARAKDEDLLETLGYLLFKELDLAVHTIVASQSAMPAKLHGGQEGDRFIPLQLLASQDEHDYDIIASRRVRNLNPLRLPEISDYYRFYQQNFEFARHLTEEAFTDTYPFQPRCFEVVRRITSRDLPGPRSGIRILYEVLQNREVLARDSLIRTGDLIHSEHLLRDCLSKPVYKPHYTAYNNAMQALPSLSLSAEDLDLAKILLTTLYLWYEANFDRPHALTVKDLTEATLLVDNVLKAEDSVLLLLHDLNALSQIHLEGETASFIPSDSIVESRAIFSEYVRKVEKGDRYPIIGAWNDSLLWKTLFTNFKPGMFADLEIERPINRSFEVHNLQYSGEIILATRWQPDWGLPLVADDQHFRIVIMVADVAQRVKPEELRDPRIAVIYPSALGEEAMRAAAEYLAWHRMNEDWKTRTGKEADTHQPWLSVQKSTYINNVLQTHLGLYRNGTIVTRDSLGIAAREIFSKVGFENQASLLVEKTLSASYEQQLFDWTSMRSVLTPAEAGKLFEGYFSKSPAPAQVTATKNYGVGLGLSTPDQPGQFAPQTGAQVLVKITELLSGERGGELKVYKIFETLSRPPYGLPYVVVQFYLLAFVRRNNPRVDLSLKPSHKIRTRDGRQFAPGRITAASITEIQWKPDLWSSFDALVPAAGPHWNDVLAYGRLIVDDLRTSVNPSEIEAESQRLLERIERTSSEVSQQQSSIQVLERTLGVRLSTSDQQIFSDLKALCEERSSYEAFYEKAIEIFQSPDNLRDTIQAYGRMKDLASVVAQVGEAQRYLKQAALKDSDRELKAMRMTLLTQIEDLAGLAAQPHLWSGIWATFEDFKKRYRNEYQKFHRDTNEALATIRHSLSNIPRQLDALALLNGITELGPAVGQELAQRYTELCQGVELCPVTDYLRVTIDANPVCAECQREMTYTAPVHDVENFTQDLKKALEAQQNRLASETIRRVLESGHGDALGQFLQVIQAANLTALVNVLDENIVRIIRNLLREGQIITLESPVIGSLLRKYSSLEEKDIAQAVSEFQALLQQAFEKAHQANPGKKTIRINLK